MESPRKNKLSIDSRPMLDIILEYVEHKDEETPAVKTETDGTPITVSARSQSRPLNASDLMQTISRRMSINFKRSVSSNKDSARIFKPTSEFLQAINAMRAITELTKKMQAPKIILKTESVQKKEFT